MPTEKRSTTFRLSEEARDLLEQLAQRHGITQTAVLEMAIRDLARRDLPTATGLAGKKRKGKGA
jgi:predicted transcriptional regulator